MGLETDFYRDSVWWWWIEQMLMLIYIFEITVRLKHKGLNFFTDEHEWGWNWLDFVVVAAGVSDSWFVPLFRMQVFLCAYLSSSSIDRWSGV